MPNNFDAFIPEVWSARVIEKLYQQNVALAVCANTDYEGEIRAAGDTVWVRTYGRITTQKYIRGQPITYQSLAPTKESLTITDAEFFAFNVDDLDVAQADIDPYAGYVREGSIALSELIDTKVFSYVTSAAAANRISNSGSAIDVSAVTTATAVYELLVSAGNKLDTQNAPQEGRWVIITPYVKSLVLLDTKYLVRSTALGDSVILTSRPGMTARTAPNFIGQLAGFDVYWSNNLPSNAGNYYCPYGVGKPIAYANQLQKVERIRLESTFADAVRGLILHDGTVFTEYAKRLGYIYVDNS